jgi:hypothetical protein
MIDGVRTKSLKVISDERGRGMEIFGPVMNFSRDSVKSILLRRIPRW